MNILIISGSRAESGILSNLYPPLAQSNLFNVSVCVTGEHPMIQGDSDYTDCLVLNCDYQISVKVDIHEVTASSDILNTVSVGIAKFQDLFSKNDIDGIVVLGDRYEIIAPVMAARFLDKIVIHFHGGEVTNGAFDDWIRHIVSKMSNLHFTANEVYRKRLIRMGEQPESIFTIGSIALEHINKVNEFYDSNVGAFVDRFKNDFVLLTFHPETNNVEPIAAQIRSVINFIEAEKDRAFLITGANSDPGGSEINNALRRIATDRNNIFYKSNLGQNDYVLAIKNCLLALGNSSSALVEVPALGKCSINLGRRQDGRLFCKSILHLPLAFTHAEITEIFDRVLTSKKNELFETLPYGGGGAVVKFLDIISGIDFDKFRFKEFYDG